MQECMLVYRFANGNRIITIASPNKESAKQLVFEQAPNEAILTLLDESNPEAIENVMSIYKNETRH